MVAGGGLGKAAMNESTVDKRREGGLLLLLLLLWLLLSLWKGRERKSWRETKAGPPVWKVEEAEPRPWRGWSRREERSISCQTSSMVDLMHGSLGETEGEGSETLLSVEDETVERERVGAVLLVLLARVLWFYQEGTSEGTVAAVESIVGVLGGRRKASESVGDGREDLK